ncbi:MAG: hypothetical protein ABL949_08855 [Fimbriimonadaceae bacterium]
MAGLIKNILVVSAVIGLAGAFIQSQGVAGGSPGKDDDYLEGISPKAIGPYTFIPSSTDPGRSYEIQKDVRDTLKPFGIVPRVYKDSRTSRQFEVLIISSNTKESFHDQRVCFPAQGNTPLKEEIVQLETADRGTVPVTITKYPSLVTAYLYRGPENRYFARPQELTLHMLKTVLMGGTNLDSKFYRFLTNDMTVKDEELLAFAREYLDTVYKTSKGTL